MKKNKYQIMTIAAMGILLYGLSVASILTPEKKYSDNENRALATMPVFSLENFVKGKFGSDYETYITDQFIGRDTWITTTSYLDLALGRREINGVYFCSDDYLVETHKNSEIDKEQAVVNAERLAEFLSQYEVTLGEDRVKAMLVPTAGTILSDKLPPFAGTFDQAEYLQDFEEIAGTSAMNLIQALSEKKGEYLYYRTDHHWTALGAYYAYEQWAKEMGFTPWKLEDFQEEVVSDDFLGTLYSKVNVVTKPDEITLYYPTAETTYSVEYDLQTKSDTLYAMSHLDTKDKYAVYLDGNHGIVKIGTENKNGRKLLLIKDSYAHCFAPFAINHYEETLMIDFRYYRGNISELIEAEGITDILVLYNIPNFVADKNTGSFLK